jgi:hypothetical protein
MHPDQRFVIDFVFMVHPGKLNEHINSKLPMGFQMPAALGPTLNI